MLGVPLADTVKRALQGPQIHGNFQGMKAGGFEGPDAPLTSPPPLPIVLSPSQRQGPGTCQQSRTLGHLRPGKVPMLGTCLLEWVMPASQSVWVQAPAPAPDCSLLLRQTPGGSGDGTVTGDTWTGSLLWPFWAFGE